VDKKYAAPDSLWGGKIDPLTTAQIEMLANIANELTRIANVLEEFLAKEHLSAISSPPDNSLI
tara:strand:+ start:733 stop:921 length:189 start_codon:yes stop_codon:yes gene_type:complete